MVPGWLAQCFHCRSVWLFQLTQSFRVVVVVDHLDVLFPLLSQNPVVSHYVTQAECNLLNEINYKHCDKEYGNGDFTTSDLIVDKEHFEKFFNYLLDRIRESGGVVPDMTAVAVARPTAPDVKPLVHAASSLPPVNGNANAHNNNNNNNNVARISYAKQQELKKQKQQQMQLQKQMMHQKVLQQQKDMHRQQQLHLQQQSRLPHVSTPQQQQQQQQQQQHVVIPTSQPQQRLPQPLTGWVQLNNTMIPYVYRAVGDKFLPVEIVCGAAQLLSHVQDRKVRGEVERRGEVGDSEAAYSCAKE